MVNYCEFALTVVTFEGFLRLTPEIQITQKVETSDEDASTGFEENTPEMINTEDLPADFASNEINQQVNSNDIVVEEIIEIPVEDDTVEQSLIANDVELNDIPVEQESNVLTPDVNAQATKEFYRREHFGRLRQGRTF